MLPRSPAGRHCARGGRPARTPTQPGSPPERAVLRALAVQIRVAAVRCLALHPERAPAHASGADPSWVGRRLAHAGRSAVRSGLMPPPAPPRSHHEHRSVAGGAARASVFGVSDGLVSNISLILGFAGSGAHASVVRLAGLAGLLAGAISMAAGEWVSVSAQNELITRELDVERRELARNPEAETAELTRLYESRGVPAGPARETAEAVMRVPETALSVHAREELGVSPETLPNPWLVAAVSFGCFALGAALPVIPWLIGSGRGRDPGVDIDRRGGRGRGRRRHRAPGRARRSSHRCPPGGDPAGRLRRHVPARRGHRRPDLRAPTLVSRGRAGAPGRCGGSPARSGWGWRSRAPGTSGTADRCGRGPPRPSPT